MVSALPVVTEIIDLLIMVDSDVTDAQRGIVRNGYGSCAVASHLNCPPVFVVFTTAFVSIAQVALHRIVERQCPRFFLAFSSGIPAVWLLVVFIGIGCEGIGQLIASLSFTTFYADEVFAGCQVGYRQVALVPSGVDPIVVVCPFPIVAEIIDLLKVVQSEVADSYRSFMLDVDIGCSVLCHREGPPVPAVFTTSLVAIS